MCIRDSNEHDKNEWTLRGGGEEINNQLEHQWNERLAMAGMEVVEARINYLAYAPEIAAVMLRHFVIILPYNGSIQFAVNYNPVYICRQGNSHICLLYTSYPALHPPALPWKPPLHTGRMPPFS